MSARFGGTEYLSGEDEHPPIGKGSLDYAQRVVNCKYRGAYTFASQSVFSHRGLFFALPSSKIIIQFMVVPPANWHHRLQEKPYQR